MEIEPNTSHIGTQEIQEELQARIATGAYGSEFMRLAVSGALQIIDKDGATETVIRGSDEEQAERE
jgi:hypothetical protein